MALVHFCGFVENASAERRQQGNSKSYPGFRDTCIVEVQAEGTEGRWTVDGSAASVVQFGGFEVSGHAPNFVEIDMMNLSKASGIHALSVSKGGYVVGC